MVRSIFMNKKMDFFLDFVNNDFFEISFFGFKANTLF